MTGQSHVSQVQPPPFWARLGCGLSVAAFLAVLFTCMLVFFLVFGAYEVAVNIYYAGPERMGDLLLDLFKHFSSPEVQQQVTIGIGLLFGVVMAGFWIAVAEAGNFLTWLKRR
jgi:hypothetical protein